VYARPTTCARPDSAPLFSIRYCVSGVILGAAFVALTTLRIYTLCFSISERKSSFSFWRSIVPSPRSICTSVCNRAILAKYISRSMLNASFLARIVSTSRFRFSRNLRHASALFFFCFGKPKPALAVSLDVSGRLSVPLPPSVKSPDPCRPGNLVLVDPVVKVAVGLCTVTGPGAVGAGVGASEGAAGGTICGPGSGIQACCGAIWGCCKSEYI